MNLTAAPCALSISRVIDAPRQKIFRAWTEPVWLLGMPD